MPTFPKATNEDAWDDKWLFDIRLPSGNVYSVYVDEIGYFAMGEEFENVIEADSIGGLVEKVIG